VKKYRKIHLKVLLLLAVYLFFHITNCFFKPKEISVDTAGVVLKQATGCFVHLQKSAKTTISESRSSISRLMQKASRNFILLLFFAVPAITASHLFPPVNQPETGLYYLRFCVIRI
jgi:hypothetical protein